MPKKQSAEESVSLFPFLSILACVIGILVLMIAAITLGQIGRDNPAKAGQDAEAARRAAAESQRRLEQYRAARQNIQADREQLKDLQLMEERYSEMRSTLAEARAQVEALAAQTEAREEHLRAQQELARQQADAARLAEEIARLEKQLQPLREQQETLRAELAKRQAPPEEAQVIVQPSGSGADLNPTFVECAGSSVVLHDGPEPVRIPTAQLGGSEPYRQLLDKVKNTPKGTIIFLVRPDGVGTYNTARHIARSSYVTNGKLAIATQGKLDLTMFQKNP